MIINTPFIRHKMGLKPLNDSFLFQFTQDTAGGRFIEKSKFGFILTNQDLENQAKAPRWGRVMAIGPKVEDFVVGDLVLIEPGKWTTGFKFEEQMYWRSTQEYVLATSNDESVTYTV